MRDLPLPRAAGAGATSGTPPVDEPGPRSRALGGHVPALEGLRGLAILLVIIFHHTVMESRSRVDDVFIRVARFGWCGVDLFFVLSGFLITGILLDAKGSPRYFRSFYARRTLRIFPLYYAVILFTLVFLPRLFPASDLARMGHDALASRSSLWYWLYCSNFLTARDGFNHPVLSIAWSLAIEEQFYLVWAPLVAWTARPTLLRVCIGLVLLAPALRILQLWLAVDPVAIYVMPFNRMDSFGLGASLALLAERDGGLSRLLPGARRLGWIVASILGGLLVVETALAIDDIWAGPIMQSAGYTLVAVLFGATLVAALEGGQAGFVRRVCGSRMLRMLGKYSYALYLVHVPIRRVVRDSVFPVAAFPTIFESQLPGQLLFYGVATAPALAVAWASWHLLEKQMLKLKRYFPY